jgi:hypothetical protein
MSRAHVKKAATSSSRDLNGSTNKGLPMCEMHSEDETCSSVLYFVKNLVIPHELVKAKLDGSTRWEEYALRDATGRIVTTRGRKLLRNFAMWKGKL